MSLPVSASQRKQGVEIAGRSRIWWGNLAFEAELQQRTPSARARELVSAFAPCLVALTEPGDAVWLPGAIDDACRQRLATAIGHDVHWVSDSADIARLSTNDNRQLEPWGQSLGVQRLAREFDLPFQTPALDVVADANSRGFSFALEQQFCVGLPGSQCVASLAELHAWLRDFPPDARWVIKSAYSAAARDRWLGRGKQVRSQDAHAIAGSLQQHGYVICEPWVERIAEVGLQFAVPVLSAGPPVFLGAAELLSAADGRYVGSRFACDASMDDVWRPAIETGLRAAIELQARGYFGPLGIDAMRYRATNGSEKLRSLQDINARYTMGRVALGWRKCLQDNEQAVWRHGRWSNGKAMTELPSLAAGVRSLVTSPAQVRGKPVPFGSVLLIAESSHELTQAETALKAWLR